MSYELHKYKRKALQECVKHQRTIRPSEGVFGCIIKFLTIQIKFTSFASKKMEPKYSLSLISSFELKGFVVN